MSLLVCPENVEVNLIDVSDVLHVSCFVNHFQLKNSSVSIAVVG